MVEGFRRTGGLTCFGVPGVLAEAGGVTIICLRGDGVRLSCGFGVGCFNAGEFLSGLRPDVRIGGGGGVARGVAGAILRYSGDRGCLVGVCGVRGGSGGNPLGPFIGLGGGESSATDVEPFEANRGNGCAFEAAFPKSISGTIADLGRGKGVGRNCLGEAGPEGVLSFPITGAGKALARAGAFRCLAAAGVIGIGWFSIEMTSLLVRLCLISTSGRNIALTGFPSLVRDGVPGGPL